MRKCPKLTPKQIQELQDIINNSQSSGREVRRAQAVLFLDKEINIKMIIALTKYQYRQIFGLRKNYLDGGITAIKDKRKGKPKELLTKKQRKEIIKILKVKTPKDYYYDCNYWTSGILGDLIEREYNVKYKSKTSIYLIFRRARFTYHKPGRVYEKRDEKEVRKWRKTTQIQVKQTLKEENTVVLVEDEMVLSTETTFQKIWLPQGEYPRIEISSKKKACSVYGFLNIKTGQEHAFKTKWQNMYITYDILGQLRKIYAKEKILLIWDQAPWHKGSKAQEFIQKDKNIQTIYFPRSAPEENPQEHVWKNGRSHVSHNEFIADIDKLTDRFVKYLNDTRFYYSLLKVSAKS